MRLMRLVLVLLGKDVLLVVDKMIFVSEEGAEELVVVVDVVEVVDVLVVVNVVNVVVNVNVVVIVNRMLLRMLLLLLLNGNVVED